MRRWYPVGSATTRHARAQLTLRPNISRLRSESSDRIRLQNATLISVVSPMVKMTAASKRAPGDMGPSERSDLVL
jgi:hypothetical protein